MAKRPKKPVDPAHLKRLADEIEQHKHGDLDRFLERLKGLEKVTTRFADGTYHVRMAGITATGTAGYWFAFANWANAARRQIGQGG